MYMRLYIHSTHTHTSLGAYNTHAKRLGYAAARTSFIDLRKAKTTTAAAATTKAENKAAAVEAATATATAAAATATSSLFVGRAAST